MVGFSRLGFKQVLKKWYRAWNDHNLKEVVDLFHDDIIFENWDGVTISGKKKLQRVWASWFKNHGNFCFIEKETFIDEIDQKVLFSWKFTWPSRQNNSNKTETIYGVDILHFSDNKIIRKNTFSKKKIECDGQKISV